MMKSAKNIKEIYKAENGCYAAPRIQIVLENRGDDCSITKVARYLRLLNLYSTIRVKRMHRKPKEHKVANSGYGNIVKCRWLIYDNNELWVTDVTYIKLNRSFSYLSILKDAKTGFIVGHKVSLRNDNQIYEKTLEMAEKYRDINDQLIIHSDNGVQYTSIWTRRYTKKNNILISLSKPENSVDNEMCEPFLFQLRQECPQVLKQTNFDELKKVVANYIYNYNYKRIMVNHRDTPASV